MRSLRKLRWLVFGVALVALVPGSSGTSFASQNPGAEFSFRLYKGMAKINSDKNFVFSPFALRSALGIAALGARGRTQKQLGKAPEPWVSKREPSYKLL